MSLDADIDLLVNVPFFEGFSAEHLKLIAFSAESRSLPEKLLLYDEGQLLHSAYLVISGTMRAGRKAGSAPAGEGREIGPGALLGARALILDTRARESIRVETRSRVLQIRKALFRRLLQEYPQIALTMRARLARNLQRSAAEFSVVAARLTAMED